MHARFRGVVFAGFLAFVGGAVALAGVGAAPPLHVQPNTSPVPMTVPPIASPAHTAGPAATLPPLALPGANVPDMMHMRSSVVRRIPRSAFAALPRQTRANTFTPDDIRSGRRHPMSATGSTVNITTGCLEYGNYVFGNPCTIQWWSTFGAGALNGNDNVEDVYLDPPDPTTFNAYASFQAKNADPKNIQTLNENGTYVLGTYDTTGNFWINVAYIQVGNTNTLETFSDQYDTVPQSNFTGGSTVYFSTSGLQGADDYAYYIEATSTAPTCVFLYPSPGGNPPAGLCNPNSALSRLPALGVFNGLWAIPAAEPTGTYSLVLYDTTAQQRVAQIQFSVVKNGSAGSISMKGVPGASGTAAPSPAPAAPTPAAIFAFDSTTENADSGLTATVSGLTNGHSYREIISDPSGIVQYTKDVNNLAGTSTVVNWTFGNNQVPTNYPNDAYTLTVYDKAGLSAIAGTPPNAADVAASEAFQIVGYNVATIFTNPNGTALTLSAGGTATSGLEFQNDGGSVNWNPQNADGIAQISFTTGANGVTMSLGAGSSSCGANCETQTVVDSSGVSWTFTNKCAGAGNTAGCVLTALPTTAGESLAPNNTYVTLPNITWTVPVADTTCATGCEATTTVLPVDGADWSAANQTQATNYVTVNFGNATSWSGTGHVYFIGTRNGGFTAGPDIHGFTPRSNPAGSVQGMYASNEPAGSAAAGSDVWDIHIKNTSTGPSAADITEFELGEPPPMSGGNVTINMDASSPTGWNIVGCPTGLPADVNCFQVKNGNAGIAPGASEDLYFDLNPGAASAFAFTDFTLQTLQTGGANNIFTVSPDATNTVYVGQTNPQSIDSTAFGSYSLDNSLMTGSFAPNSVGSPSSTTVTVALTNASNAGTFPDEIDAIAVDIPSNEAWAPGVTAPASGWSYLGSTTPVAGTTRYWFGLCAAQKPGNTGTWNPPAGNNMTTCAAATEQASSLQPNQTFNASGTLTVPAAVAGPISGTIWTHGANGDGWNGSGKPISLAISATGATAGFSAVYPYSGSVVPVTAPNIPTVGADSDTTFGNTFQYTVTNTGASAGTCAGGIPCNSLTKVSVTIPYQDINNITGTDTTGVDWQVTPKAAPTATVTIVGSQGAGKVCSATVTNPLPLGAPTAKGSFVVNGGAGCYVAPGDSMVITFNAQAPYKVNDIFAFPATFSVLTGSGTTTNVSAAESWTNDTDVEIVANASLVIVVDPGTGPGGFPSHPSPNCPACTFGASNINFGGVANNQSVTGSDLATVSVYTDVGNPAGWGLYVSTNNNPTNTTGNPTNELLTEVDSANSSQSMGLGWDTTSYTVVPTGGNGMLLSHAPTTVNPTRNPFDVVQSYKISVGAEAITPQTSIVTYTWIEN